MPRDIQLYRVLQEDAQSASTRSRTSRSRQCYSCRWRYKEANHQFLASWNLKRRAKRRKAGRISELVFHNRSSTSGMIDFVSPPTPPPPSLTHFSCLCIHYYNPSNISVRATLSEICSLFGTDRIWGQIEALVYVLRQRTRHPVG